MSGLETRVEVPCTPLRETDKAHLLEVVTQCDGLIEMWVPKSQVELESTGTSEGDTHFASAPDWLWISRCQEDGIELAGYEDGVSVIITPHGLD